MKPRMQFDELRELATDARVSSAKLSEAIVGAVSIAAIQATATAKTSATIFTGENVGAIRPRPVEVRPMAAGISVRQVIEASAPHAPVREYGRAGGATAPPYEPIRRWVELLYGRGKIDLGWVDEDTDEERISVAAQKIVFTIQRRGLRAEKFMLAGAQVGRATLSEELEQVVSSFKAQIERGGIS